MTRKRRWLWILIFVLASLLLGTLATSWNVVLVRDYEHLKQAAKIEVNGPWINIILGMLGFAGLLSGLILLFARLMREMKLSQMQSEFLAAVTHQLKTPIATLELASKLLQDGGLSADETRQLWSSHDSELRRLKLEVETLLEAARLEHAQPKVLREPLWLEHWIEVSIPRWKNILGPGATLERKGDPLEGWAEIDLKLLETIADNLIENARKFSKNQKPQVTLESRLLPSSGPWEQSTWQVCITDHGWGFDPKDADRIFDRFFRSKSSAPHPVPGTGLGLHLAANAGRLLGLRLRGSSEGVGQGASFTIEGPLKDATL